MCELVRVCSLCGCFAAAVVVYLRRMQTTKINYKRYAFSTSIDHWFAFFLLIVTYRSL